MPRPYLVLGGGISGTTALPEVTSHAYDPGSFTVATARYAVIYKRLILTGTERLTLEGTSNLRIADL